VRWDRDQAVTTRPLAALLRRAINSEAIEGEADASGVTCSEQMEKLPGMLRRKTLMPTLPS
jgi:hypothetical protein